MEKGARTNAKAEHGKFGTAKTRGGCIISVYSTPRVPENHARYIRHRVDGCPHEGG